MKWRILLASLFVFRILWAGNVFAQCAGTQSFTVNPAPNGGGNTYLPGTVVTYCYTMVGFNQLSANWVDGFEVTLGSGWQAGSLAGQGPPANCGGAITGGQWIWSSLVTGTATGQTNGPGYFFDLNNDGNPGNDYGDNNVGGCTWSFCFQVTVGNTPGASLSVTVAALSDGEIGSWTSFACTGVPFTLSTSTVAANSTAVTVNTPAAICQGASATLTAGGATSYTWSPATGLSATTGATVTANPTTTTTYTVTGTGGCNPCTATTTVTVNPIPNVSISPGTVAICSGTSTNLTASGATTYSWSPVTGLSASTGATVTANPTTTTTYTVTGTSAGCTASSTATVTVNSNPTISVSPSAPSVCAGNSVSLTASGANTYTWSPATGLSATTGATVSANPAATTTYTVTGTSVGCTGTGTVTVSVVGFSATASATNATCNGAADGTSTVTVNPPGAYTYSWNTVPVQNTATATGLPAGNYTVTVSGGGCTSTDNATVTEPSALLVSVSTTSACPGLSNGTASATASGGTGPYTVTWGGVNPNALAAGSYTVSVTDFNGCTISQNFTISNSNALDLNLITNDVSCFGLSDGVATLTITGGNAPYTQNWGGANPLSLAAGNYSVTVTDQLGCSSTQNFTISEPAVLSATVTTTDVSCFGLNDGMAQTTINGGTAPYSQNWGGVNNNALAAGNFSVTITDANGCQVVLPYSITEPTALTVALTTTDATCAGYTDGSAVLTIAGGTAPYAQNWGGSNPNALGAGVYNYTVTDGLGCQVSGSALINEPPGISVQVATTDVLCNGMNQGTATLAISGGSAPYTTNWGGLNQNALPAGNFNVTVTDANACVLTVPFTINEPAALNVSITSLLPTACIGQNVQLTGTVSGGMAPYSTAWSAPSDPNFIPNGNSGNTLTLTTSTYNYAVTDANGCTATASFTQPVSGPLNIVLPAIAPVCPGQSAQFQLTGTGGNGNYVWNWNLGPNPISSQVITPSIDTSLTLTFTLNDNCTAQPASATVTVLAWQPPALNVTPDSISGCPPLIVHFSDNTSPAAAQWQWQFNDTFQPDAFGVGQQVVYVFQHPGTYHPVLTLTTQQGCQVNDTMTVVVYPEPTASFIIDPQGPLHLNEATFSFIDASTGGSQWLWDLGDGTLDTARSAVHLYGDTGVFTIVQTVTNVFGCVDVATDRVKVEPDVTFFVPNAFSPNGDGHNDKFGIKGVGLKSVYLSIHNRWGEQLFEIFAQDQFWDGTYKGRPVPLGVYSWSAYVTDVNGVRTEYMGSVRVLR